MDNETHWIFKKLVTHGFRCAVVKVDEANIRTGPGTRYRESNVSPALQYDSFKVIRRTPSWVKVKDELGNTGWIYRRLLWVQ